VIQDVKEEGIFRPAAEALFKQHLAEFHESDPVTHCLPGGPLEILGAGGGAFYRIMQFPNIVALLYERGLMYRQIFMDGRELPNDPNPTWMGYSVGHWEGDTFVVDTIGMNDKLWDDSYGNPRSDQTHLIERYRRLNHDTLELQITIDDPKAYTKPWVSPPKLHKLEPGWEIAEWFCVLDEDNAYDDAVRKPAGVPAAPK
jgi:hypothetical protein